VLGLMRPDTFSVEAHSESHLVVTEGSPPTRVQHRRDWLGVPGERRTAVVANQPKILLVDDERTIADTLAQIFSTNGYEARAAYSAEQAIEITAEWMPDLAIIDVVLPRMNGIDLAVLLTAQCPACRLLLFSGQSITADLLAEAVTKGHTFDILAKPVHPALLLETAGNLLVPKQSEQSRGPAA
jgi:DNA-binding NtrC family response regulator